MKRNGWSLIMIGAMLLSIAVVAPAQEKKVVRIGLLAFSSGDESRNIAPFREELHKLGYVEGKNIVIDYPSAGGDRNRLRELADGLVRTKVDLIVVTGNQAIAAAKAATSTIPIIALGAGDLVGTGIVSSLARPGGNVTGSTRMSTELGGKRIELLKESVTRLSRVSVIVATRQDHEELKEMDGPALQLGVKIQPTNIQSLSEFQDVFASMVKERSEALIIVHSGFTFANRGKLLGLASKHRLPSMCEESAWANAGCLISYGPDVPHLARRGAYFVDKVLKGAKPADLPVEQPMKFEFVINLKTAKQIGLTIPQWVLVKADRVVK
jgi:putative ABC transport system substrate-binding protein